MLKRRRVTEEGSQRGKKKICPSPWRTEDGAPNQCYARWACFDGRRMRRETSSPREGGPRGRVTESGLCGERFWKGPRSTHRGLETGCGDCRAIPGFLPLGGVGAGDCLCPAGPETLEAQRWGHLCPCRCLLISRRGIRGLRRSGDRSPSISSVSYPLLSYLHRTLLCARLLPQLGLTGCLQVSSGPQPASSRGQRVPWSTRRALMKEENLLTEWGGRTLLCPPPSI